jgi:CBS domain containing-hemolysin-like protein
MPLDELLRTFQQQHSQIALVIDEHGSMEGLVVLGRSIHTDSGMVS